MKCHRFTASHATLAKLTLKPRSFANQEEMWKTSWFVVLNIISLLNGYSYQIKLIVLMNDWKKRQFVLQVDAKCDRYLLCFDFWNIDVTEAKLERGLEKTIDNFFTQNLRSQIAKMKQKLNIDHVFSHIGEMGPQQIRYLVLMSVMTMYSPQFMIQVNQTRQSFINFWCTFRRKCRSLTTFKSCHLLFWCVRGKLQYFPFILQYNFVGRDDINFTCHLKNGSSLANYCLDGKLSSCKRIDFQTDDADSIVSALSISQWFHGIDYRGLFRILILWVLSV